MKRIHSIDITRGLVMIIMALDHVRDLMHTTSITQQPTDLSTTTASLFFTRLITHICAPTFVFLSGSSAFISFVNKNNISKTQHFLLSRGIWLIILDFTLVNFAVWFDIRFSVFLFDVLSAIGFGFIVLAILIRVSPKTLAIIGLIIIFGHNLIPLIPINETSGFKRILMPFFLPGAFPFGSGKIFVMGYTPIPWLGIMLVGFASGKLFMLEENKKKSLFLKIGLAAIVLFILTRFINLYGDSFPWSSQKNSIFTFLSFINVTKYPPSLSFCLLMLGIMFLMLSFVEGVKNKFTDIATVYGKVPLFYFVIHFYVVHLLMFAMVFLQGFKGSDLIFGFNFGRPKEGSGLSLLGIYLVWIGVVILLYPLCKWYGNYKEFHREKKWLKYL
ncbi:MAG: heparan-alpha-glucosaminide N-acetyltransferase domain-containing protein [Ferruginibacter sp.]